MPQNEARVAHHEIAAADDGQRLDNWLLARLRGVPRSHVYRLIRSGQVRVNGGRAKAATRVATGDRVRVPPVRQATREDGAPAESLQRLLRDAVLWRDDEIMVLNKPAGVAAHGGTGVRHGVIETIRELEGADWQLAHRLDRETSGCLLLVRSRALQNEFQARSAAGEIGKHYLALVHGRWARGTQTIRSQLRSERPESGERVMRSADDGKQAVSHFRIERRLGEQTLMAVRIETGRTHQIRVQAADAGHPVCGDRKYGDRERDRALRPAGLRRMCLHAAALQLSIGGRELDLNAPMPAEFVALLEALA